MCMWDGGEDPPAIYRAAVHRTRKERRCDECGRPIAVGERYENAFMVCEGRGLTFATCEHCKVAMSWLLENCGGYLHGGVWEDLEEHIIEYPKLRFSLGRLDVGRRRRWKRFDNAGMMVIPPVPPSIASVLEVAA